MYTNRATLCDNHYVVDVVDLLMFVAAVAAEVVVVVVLVKQCRKPLDRYTSGECFPQSRNHDMHEGQRALWDSWRIFR